MHQYNVHLMEEGCHTGSYKPSLQAAYLMTQELASTNIFNDDYHTVHQARILCTHTNTLCYMVFTDNYTDALQKNQANKEFLF